MPTRSMSDWTRDAKGERAKTLSSITPTSAAHENTGGPALAVRGLTVAYGEQVALFSVDADFASGRRTAIVGPNGAGKSTLIKAALGVAKPLSGTCRFFGQPIDAVRQRVAYVPQRASVDWDFPARVKDVVAMGLYRELGLLRPFRPRERARVDAALELVDMMPFAERQIGQLSGGQAQRVFIARALVAEADLLLLDEPLAGVDSATETAIMRVLSGLCAAGRTIIAVHHDLSTLTAYFDDVVFINRRVIGSGPVSTTVTADLLKQTYGTRLPEPEALVPDV